MRLIRFSPNRSFADCKAILLMSLWRAIPSSKYVSIDASIISTYSLSVAPLVETRKKDIPRFLRKCPIHFIDIHVAYVLHTIWNPTHLTTFHNFCNPCKMGFSWISRFRKIISLRTHEQNIYPSKAQYIEIQSFYTTIYWYFLIFTYSPCEKCVKHAQYIL